MRTLFLTLRFVLCSNEDPPDLRTKWEKILYDYLPSSEEPEHVYIVTDSPPKEEPLSSECLGLVDCASSDLRGECISRLPECAPGPSDAGCELEANSGRHSLNTYLTATDHFRFDREWQSDHKLLLRIVKECPNKNCSQNTQYVPALHAFILRNLVEFDGVSKFLDGSSKSKNLHQFVEAKKSKVFKIAHKHFLADLKENVAQVTSLSMTNMSFYLLITAKNPALSEFVRVVASQLRTLSRLVKDIVDERPFSELNSSEMHSLIVTPIIRTLGSTGVVKGALDISLNVLDFFEKLKRICARDMRHKKEDYDLLAVYESWAAFYSRFWEPFALFIYRRTIPDIIINNTLKALYTVVNYKNTVFPSSDPMEYICTNLNAFDMSDNNVSYSYDYSLPIADNLSMQFRFSNELAVCLFRGSNKTFVYNGMVLANVGDFETFYTMTRQIMFETEVFRGYLASLYSIYRYLPVGREQGSSIFIRSTLCQYASSFKDFTFTLKIHGQTANRNFIEVVGDAIDCLKQRGVDMRSSEGVLPVRPIASYVKNARSVLSKANCKFPEVQLKQILSDIRVFLKELKICLSVLDTSYAMFSTFWWSEMSYNLTPAEQLLLKSINSFRIDFLAYVYSNSDYISMLFSIRNDYSGILPD